MNKQDVDKRVVSLSVRLSVCNFALGRAAVVARQAGDEALAQWFENVKEENGKCK